MHWQGATSASEQDAYSTDDGYDQWQTALIEWTPEMVRFILNGQIIGTSTQHIPDTPMHWVLQTETATDGTVPAPTTAGHVDVAWVSVYRPTV
jgi:beta-glucanase (GH16 family)